MSDARSSSHPTTAPAAVQAAGVGKRYGRTWALRRVDLRVAPGETVALLGPNGSGKSTLLRLVATAARPTRGELRVFGLSVVQDGDAVRRRVGLLAHPAFLYNELTGMENLRFAALMYGMRPSETALRERLVAVGLAAAGDTRVRAYSQGMTQRLALARAVLHEPDVLLLDEPYTALDVDGLDLIDRLLARHRSLGRTAIIATHQVERGLARSDRVVALRAGRLAYDGPADGYAALTPVVPLEA